MDEIHSRVALVRCMRTHGVDTFLCATVNGHASLAMVRADGIHRWAPAVARRTKRLPPGSSGSVRSGSLSPG